MVHNLTEIDYLCADKKNNEHMKKRLKIFSLKSSAFYFLGLFDPDDTEGISKDIYSVLKDYVPDSTAKTESLRIANILKEKTLYCDSNELAYSFHEDIIKYFACLDDGRYITGGKGQALSYDYKEAYLFTSSGIEEISSQYKDLGKKLTIKEVNRDPNLYPLVCDIMKRIYHITVQDGFIKSQKEDYFSELTQKYILHGDTYYYLATTIASCMLRDCCEYEECLSMVGKAQPS